MDKTELLALLDSIGVVSVEVEYSGEAGRGDVTSVVETLGIAPNNGYPTTLVDWRTEIANYILELLTSTYPTWKSETLGSYGTVVIDVDAATVTVEHSVNGHDPATVMTVV